MPFTTAFRDFIPAAVSGIGPPTLFTNGNSYIGLGDSSTAFAVGQTDLQASSNKLRKAMEASYPTLATNVLTFRSVFGATEANYAINEWGVFNASSSGTMMCRKVESWGTKANPAVWQFTAAITFAVS